MVQGGGVRERVVGVAGGCVCVYVPGTGLGVSEGGLAYPYSTSIVTNGVQLYSRVLFVP